ncbi:MAG: polysaccharide deacetylase family protein [Mesorhizobium sp.]
MSPKRIWLTLDDGPHPVHTEQILRVLDRHRIKATFFVIGEKVADQDAMVRRAFDAGHRIGNHSFTHRRMTELSPPEIRDEIEKTDQLISRYTNGQKIFRPPFGAHDAKVDAIVDALGHRIVMWHVDPTDWDPRHQPKAWIGRALHEMGDKPDCVILNHDDRATTAAHYDLFIERIKRTGSVNFEHPDTLG